MKTECRRCARAQHDIERARMGGGKKGKARVEGVEEARGVGEEARSDERDQQR